MLHVTTSTAIHARTCHWTKSAHTIFKLQNTEPLQHNREAKALKQAEDNSNNEQNRRRTSGLNQSIQSSKPSKTNSTPNG